MTRAAQHDARRPPPPVSPAAAVWTVHETPVGPLLLAATAAGLVQVAFHAGKQTVDRSLARLGTRLGTEPVRDGAAPPLIRAAEELDAYFRGELHRFSFPLDWRLTTGFHRKVLEKLAATVPYGAVVGYQDLADRVGEPGAARAVGMAMGANPLPVVVPCHRVVESGGGLGGFGGGLPVKRALLALEGVLPEPLF